MFLTTYKEYSKHHKEFNLKKLKAICVEIIRDQENKDTPAKNLKQLRKLWMLSSVVPKEFFWQIKFISK